MFDTLRALDLFDDPFFTPFNGGRAMHAPVNLSRENNQYVLEADLPGFDPASIDVSVDGQWLTIRADRTTESETEDARWLVRERSAASVVRQFAVGQDVDVDGITADYRDGVLKVVLPVRAEALPRKIDVAVNAAPDRQAIEANTAGAGQEQSNQGKAQPARSVAS